jgi:hypothetical protein
MISLKPRINIPKIDINILVVNPNGIKLKEIGNK